MQGGGGGDGDKWIVSIEIWELEPTGLGNMLGNGEAGGKDGS